MSDRVYALDVLLSRISEEISKDIWGIDPKDWPGGEHRPVEITFKHPDGVTDWLMDLPVFRELREQAEQADDVEFEHEPELN